MPQDLTPTNINEQGFQELSRPDIERILRERAVIDPIDMGGSRPPGVPMGGGEMVARGMSGDNSADIQSISQYLYSLGENVEWLRSAVRGLRRTEGGVISAIDQIEEGGTPEGDPYEGLERYFPFVYGLPYDNRNISSASDPQGGAWLARDVDLNPIGTVAIGDTFPWNDIKQLEFSFRDAEGTDHQALYNSRELQTGTLICGIRRLDEDDVEYRYCYEQTGALVLDTANFVAKMPVERSTASATFDLRPDLFRNFVPESNTDWRFRFLLPEVRPRNYFPRGRKPSYFFTEVSAEIAAYLETLTDRDCIEDEDTIELALETVSGDPVAGDIITFYRGETVISRVYQSEDGGKWCGIRVFIDGNLVVHGSIQADAIHLGGGVVRGTDGGLAVKVGPGVEIDSNGNVVPSLGAGLSIVNNQITAAVTAESLAQIINSIQVNPQGFRPGALPNRFSAVTRAGAENLRDTQTLADAAWLKTYDDDANTYITLLFD